MQIFVSTASGSTAYDVEATTSVDTLKAMIENKEFIPSNLIRLVNGSDALEGGTLAGNGVEDEDTLALVLDVEAGMRRKWKKKRMRRLRRKRRKMRQRAR
jgi:small subunit ribosomal protein S27Ae